MLWAGQPDGHNSYYTLKRVLRNFPCLRYTLLFRAHPRDEAYKAGKYRELFSEQAHKVLDVSQQRDILDLYSAADLILTQFSSAGVEASHIGIPVVFVLFSDLGGQYLRRFKGYDLLPWCRDRCSFFIDNEDKVRSVLTEALFDDLARKEVIDNFKLRFGVNVDTASAIASRIRSTVKLIHK